MLISFIWISSCIWAGNLKCTLLHFTSVYCRALALLLFPALSLLPMNLSLGFSFTHFFYCNIMFLLLIHPPFFLFLSLTVFHFSIHFSLLFLYSFSLVGLFSSTSLHLFLSFIHLLFHLLLFHSLYSSIYFLPSHFLHPVFIHIFSVCLSVFLLFICSLFLVFIFILL